MVFSNQQQTDAPANTGSAVSPSSRSQVYQVAEGVKEDGSAVADPNTPSTADRRRSFSNIGPLK